MTGSVKLNSAAGGSVTLTPASTASNLTATIPAATDTLVNLGSTQTLTNKTLTSPTITGATLSGTISGGTFSNSSITAANGNTVEATSGPTSSQLSGNRNKIINGAMMIDQRNAGASVTPTDTAYTLDRWTVRCSQASKFTVQQNAGSVTPPVGFVNYLGVTSASAYSVGSSDFFTLVQYVEGFNCADLAWGTANAKTVTLSFQVYSSLTGTFGGALTSGDNNRSYPFTFTISSANTWTFVSVTIAGDSSGTWLKDSGRGIGVRFNLGAGSTYSGTSGSWASATYYSATGAQSVVGTNGATFYITGVQLEKGATATPFENRLYTTELALCQRYYEKSFAAGTAPYTNGSDASGPIVLSATPTASNTYTCQVIYSIEKRVSPSITLYNPGAAANNVSWYNAAGAITNGGSVNASAGARGFCLVLTGDTTRTIVAAHYTASAEL